MRFALSVGRSRNTHLPLLRISALTVAIFFGLLVVATISVEASQTNTNPPRSEPPPSGSDNLARKLDNSSGVISPPTQVDPGMTGIFFLRERKPPVSTLGTASLQNINFLQRARWCID